MSATATYDVLYNACYGGGLSFPKSFREAVFEAYPPESELGGQLWEKDTTTCFAWSDADIEAFHKNPSIHHCFKVVRLEPFKHGYHRLVTQSMPIDRSGEASKTRINAWEYVSEYVTKGVGFPIYHLELELDFVSPWRTAPEIIGMAHEHRIMNTLVEGHIACSLNSSTLIKVAKIPVGYKYAISEYDGKEMVHKIAPHNQIIQELVELYRTRDESKLSALTRQLLDGTLMPRDI